MKSQQKETQIKTVNCKEHKEKCTFVCLHKTCSNGFKIGCQKCRKEHGQHPNRLISISDFHAMLSKPIQYLENSTAFKLMNLKKKIQYIRNFRTSILEKEILLIESNQNIKSTTSAILQQHYRIRDVVSHLDSHSLTTNFQDYVQHLQKCRDFLAYNPVKATLVFNNEVIKSSRMQLQKHIKTSHQLIDNIRQFLIKIIEVLLANCTHQQDDEDIEYDSQDGDSTSFNIVIKNRTDVIENPNIKNKLEHQAFLEMFDEEKDVLNQEIHILEKELNFKVNILKKIRSTGSMGHSYPPEKNDHEEEFNQDQERLSSQQNFLRHTEDSNNDKERGTDQILQLKEEYETVLKNKEQYIQQLKDICKRLEQKTQSVDSFIKENKESSSLIKSRKKSEQSDSSKESLEKKIFFLEEIISNLTENCKEKEIQLETLNIKLSQIEEQSQIKASCLSKSQLAVYEEYIEKETEFHHIIDSLKEELTKKDNDIQRQKNKYNQLEQLVEKMRESNAHSQKQVLQWRNEHEQRQKKLRIQYQANQKQIENLRSKVKSEDDKIKAYEQQIENLKENLKNKTEFIKGTQQELDLKEKEVKQLQKKLLSQQKEEKSETTYSQKTQHSSKDYQQENKKIKQMKEMLDISIRKNQELKDRIYELERDVEEYKHQLRRKPNQSIIQEFSQGKSSLTSSIIQERKDQLFNLKLETVASEYTDGYPGFKKKGEKINLNNKEEKRNAYIQIKNIFKAVTEDMKTLEQRMKENNVIEKVYLKELERKRNENKNLKKELQNIKLYGSNFKPSDTQRTSSPCFKGDKQKQETKVTTSSPFKVQPVFQQKGKVNK